jgi:hypothetical protein
MECMRTLICTHLSGSNLCASFPAGMPLLRMFSTRDTDDHIGIAAASARLRVSQLAVRSSQANCHNSLNRQ